MEANNPDTLPASYNVTNEQIEAFERDGFIVVRGLLQGQDLKDAINAVNKIQRKRTLGQRLFYKLLPLYSSFEFQKWRSHRAIEKVAFESTAPTISAKLMGLDRDSSGNGRSLRLLKDAILGYNAGDLGCGWHVDDRKFWPSEDRNIGQRDAGVNVWITLSHVSAKDGGGLAVAKGSHRDTLAAKARSAIAGGNHNTCRLQQLAPDCHDRFEELKVVPDLEPGDAIIHDRYVFHRGEPFVDMEKGKKEKTKQRISLRYVPEDATFYDNDNVEDSHFVASKNMSTGDLVSKGAEYYPQTWPHRLPEERNIKIVAKDDRMSVIDVAKFVRMMMKQKK